MIEIRCPNCSRIMEAGQMIEQGQPIKCPFCKHEFLFHPEFVCSSILQELWQWLIRKIDSVVRRLPNFVGAALWIAFFISFINGCDRLDYSYSAYPYEDRLFPGKLFADLNSIYLVLKALLTVLLFFVAVWFSDKFCRKDK